MITEKIVRTYISHSHNDPIDDEWPDSILVPMGRIAAQAVWEAKVLEAGDYPEVFISKYPVDEIMNNDHANEFLLFCSEDERARVLAEALRIFKEKYPDAD